MALRRELPLELCVMIVRFLVARRIDHFDPVVAKDLQSLRLVSPMFNGAATPSLFENMVLDFSFWKVNDMKRIHELIIAPLEAQWEDEIPNFDAIRKIMRETMAVLTKLYHVENAVSTHEAERPAMAYQQIWNEIGIDLSWCFPTVADDQSYTLGQGVSYLMTSLTNNITSLKLREVPFENSLYHWRIPDQVKHLDIELKIGQEFGNLKNPVQTCFAVKDWRKQFTALNCLQTQRLSCSSDELYPNEDDWFATGGPNLYFDDLLTGTELSEDYLEATINKLEYRKHHRISEVGVFSNCTFPQLKSLILINCPLREDGLLYLAAMHQRTLRSLELHRVVFNATPGQVSVKELAKVCKEYLPNLTHIALSKIDLYDPYGYFLESSMREEVASVYRWDNGEGGGGDGLVKYAWDLERMVECLGLGS